MMPTQSAYKLHSSWGVGGRRTRESCLAVAVRVGGGGGQGRPRMAPVKGSQALALCVGREDGVAFCVGILCERGGGYKMGAQLLLETANAAPSLASDSCATGLAAAK